MSKRAPSLLLPLLVALLTLGLTAWLWQHEGQLQAQARQRQFDQSVRQTATLIGERITAYEQMLRGVRGLFHASKAVTPADFEDYVDGLLAGADTAGLRTIAWLPLGAPASARVLFAAPAADPPMLLAGGDVLADPLRGPALRAARDSGRATLSARVRTGADDGHGGGSGFLMCMATYRAGQPRETLAQRRMHADGWVCASFRVGDLMSSLYGEGTPGLAMHLHDGTQVDAGTHMHGPLDEQEILAAPYVTREYLGVANATWTLAVGSWPEFLQRSGNDARTVIALAGFFLSLALALLTWQLVTARDRATAAAFAMTRQLRDSAERYRRIVETADEGIWTVDAEGRTSFANPKLLQMLGRSAYEMLGRPWTENLHADDRATDHEAARAALRRGEYVRGELRLQRADGGELWTSVSIGPVLDESGRYSGALAMVTDITVQRQAEACRLLLEEELRQSQKMEAIGTLAGGIAHDFNNLLAAILGNVAQVQHDLGPEHPQATRLDQIRHAGAHGRSLVQQIVAFSRRLPHAREAQPLRPLVEEAATLLRSTLPALVQLELRLSDEPLCANVDLTQLHQVLLNLGTNAWHAMSSGTGRIVIGLEPAQLDAPLGDCRPGACARLWVADDGCGMDAATRERIFEPFFTTKPVGQGTGLGLAVAHGIVAAHGGAITVDSTPGRGTRFDLWLPLADVGMSDAPVPKRVAGPPSPEPAVTGQGQHVLYVDDDPLICVLVESMLQLAGYRVTTLDDPRQALVRMTAADDPVDLVVTDFNMPSMSGLELARAVRSLRPEVPVIVSSGYVSEDLPAKAHEAGVVHVLQKEYTLEQMVPLVQRTLAGL